MTAGLDLAGFVRAALAQAANVDSAAVSAETPLVDLHLDSLTLISVLAQVEAVHGIELEAEELLPMLEACRVSELVSRIEAALAARRE